MQSDLQRIPADLSAHTSEFCPFFVIHAQQAALQRTDGSAATGANAAFFSHPQNSSPTFRSPRGEHRAITNRIAGERRLDYSHQPSVTQRQTAD
jgi:hypothetical protein